MLLLDAMEDAPTLYVVLTAREHLTRPDTYRHLEHLRRAVRRRWPSSRWAVLVEFQRRGALHLNLLTKGVPTDEHAALFEAVTSRWCERVDALPGGQYVGVVGDEVGVVRYVSQHFMKQSQAPVLGWRGHRYSATRDYLVRPASVMREEARASLREKRLLWKALGRATEVAGCTPTADLVEIVFEQYAAAWAASSWKLHRAEKVPAAARWVDTGRAIVRGA